MKIDSRELEQLTQISREAGRAIMEVYGTDFQSWKKSDQSPLTQADLRADEIIRSGLNKTFPGAFVLSEESATQAPANTETYFLVDPLDGTKEFVKRNGEFTVNIALIHQEKVVGGVIFAPALNELYCAATDIGSWKLLSGGKFKLTVMPFKKDRPIRVIGSRSHENKELSHWLKQLPQPHTYVISGSSLKFCRIAEGLADIYPRLGPTNQWDTAAGQCILEVAGGRVLDPSGNPMCYGLNHPILNSKFTAIGDHELRNLIFSNRS